MYQSPIANPADQSHVQQSMQHHNGSYYENGGFQASYGHDPTYSMYNNNQPTVPPIPAQNLTNQFSALNIKSDQTSSSYGTAGQNMPGFTSATQPGFSFPPSDSSVQRASYPSHTQDQTYTNFQNCNSPNIHNMPQSLGNSQMETGGQGYTNPSVNQNPYSATGPYSNPPHMPPPVSSFSPAQPTAVQNYGTLQHPPLPPMPPLSQPGFQTNQGIRPNLPPQPYGQPPMPPQNYAHPSHHNGPPTQPQPTRGFNADGFPSAVEVMENNRLEWTGPFYTGQRGVAPPLVTTDFITRDQGNCSPRFVRSSLYAIPTTSDLMKTVGIPFTLTISPFATLHPEDMDVMISDMGQQGPVRCVRCKAYVNPFVNFIDGGRRFQCPLCTGLTEVPAEYFAHLDHTGRRIDAGQRPELCLGSYELVATAEYCKNNQLPLPPAFIFLLDVSQSAVRSGLVQLFCTQFVDRILPKLANEVYNGDGSATPLRIGFITYDHQLHFYSLSRDTNLMSPNNAGDGSQMGQNIGYGKPQMNIVADVEDVFVPSVEGFLIRPDPVAISSILELIPVQFCGDSTTNQTQMMTGQVPKQQTPDSLLGPAIQAGLEALRAANRSGKLFVMHSNLPTCEAPGKLKNREDRRLVGTDKEKTLLVPSGDFYTGLGLTCVEAGCSVDLFLFPNSYTDVATLAEVPRITSGHIYKYNCFQADLQGQQFLNDLERAVNRPKAFNAVMRVRTSTGTRPVDFFGNFNLPNTTDVEMACIDPDMAVTVEIRHDDKLQEGDVVFIQVACLYTSLSGQRRLRIHNLSLNVANAVDEVFRLSELDTHMNWLGKYAVRNLLTRNHPQVLDDLTARAAHILAAYRRHCTGGPGDSGAGSSELVLPQSMKLFPLYLQSLMKTEAFSPAESISIDDRSWHMFLVNQFDVKQSNFYFYPRLYPVHDLSINFEGDVPYPPPTIRCSYERLNPDGAYLLDNGIHLFLWLGPNLPAEWIQNTLNVPNAKNFEPEKIYDLLHLDNDISRHLCILLRKIRTDHGLCARLIVVRPSDRNEQWFRKFMVEDRHVGNSISYVDYLCHIHKEVSNLLR